MLTRYSHKSIVAIQLKKRAVKCGNLSEQTTQGGIVERYSAIFLCDVSPYLKLQGCIEARDFLNGSPLVSVCANVATLLYAALSVCGKTKGLPINLFNKRRSIMDTNATVPQSFDFVKTPQFKAVWNISESIRKNLRPSINKITMLKEFLVYADMEEVFIQDNSDDVLSGIIEVIDDLLNGFNAVSDNISDIYNDIDEFNEVKNV